MANVFKRAGRPKWYYKIRLASGLWSSPRPGYTDKRATEVLAAKEQALVERGEVGLVDAFAAHRRAPIGDHVEAFTAALEGRHRSTNYVRMMRSRLLAVLQTMRASNLAALNLGAAEVALGDMLRTNQVSPRTRDHYAATLREFGGWLVDAARIATNPFAKLGRVATDADVRVERQALTGEQVLQLAAAAETRDVQEWRRKHPGASVADLEDRARGGRARGLLYLTAVLTGLRRSELAGLRWSDLDLGEQPTVTPRAATTKAKRREPLPLDAELATRLQAHRETAARGAGAVPDADARVFRIPRDLTRQIAADAAWAEIDVVDGQGRRLDVHALRATSATLMATAGVPMQIARRLIRHTDVRLTAKHYEKVGIEQLRPGTEALGRAVWGVAPRAAPNSAQQAAAVGCTAQQAEEGSRIAQAVQAPRAASQEDTARSSVQQPKVEPTMGLEPAGKARGDGAGGSLAPRAAPSFAAGDKPLHGAAPFRTAQQVPPDLVGDLARAARALIDAGTPPLPADVRSDLVKLLSAPAAARAGGRRG